MKRILALLIAGVGTSHAATIIDTTGLTPVNQANFGTGTASNLNTGVAFTFTTGVLGTENILASIGIEGPQTGANSSTLTIELWSDTDNDSATLGGSLLATSTTTGVTLSNNTVSVFNFSPFTLSDNTVYTAHIVSSGATRIGLVGMTSTDILPNSRNFNNGALVFGGTAPNGIDASFNVVTVPEPSAALLGGLGLLALLRRRR